MPVGRQLCLGLVAAASLYAAARCADAPGPSGGSRADGGDRILHLRDASAWIAERGWLGNPAQHADVRAGDKGLVFRVGDPGRGMKWRFAPVSSFSPGALRYVWIRYRAVDAARSGDYFLAVLGARPGEASGYRTPILPSALKVDGRWHTASASLGEPLRSWTVQGLAVQVQAGGGAAEIEVASVGFSREAPALALRDMLPVESIEAPAFDDGKFRAVDLSSFVRSDTAKLREDLRLRDWFAPGGTRCCGIPFLLPAAAERSVSSTLAADDARICIPLSGRSSILALLLAARFEGDEEPAIGGGKLTEIRDVDRLLFRVHYRRGRPDAMMCLSEPEGRFALASGVQVALLYVDASRDLERLELIDRSRQMELHLLGLTAVISPPPSLQGRRPRAHPARLVDRAARDPQPARIVERKEELTLRGGAIEAAVDLQGMEIRRLRSGYLRQDLRLGAGSRLLAVAARGRDALAAEAWDLRGITRKGPARVAFTARVKEDGLDLELEGEVEAGADEISCSCTVKNLGTAADLDLVLPSLEGLIVADSRSDRLCYPKRGVVLTSESCSFSRPASGLFPVQFLDVSSRSGGGVYVRTEDRDGADRLYEASKGRGGTRLAVRHVLHLERGATYAAARCVVGVHGGDWHAALDAYRRWLKRWHRPRLPLKPSFREIFNFRQRFLWVWDPLYDRVRGSFRVEQAVEEARDTFGGLEFLHLMDWGTHPAYGRVYGRTGDHAPWDAYKGGKEAFAEAIRSVEQRGVPVGLYVEGYLLEERGLLGSGPGRSWQIVNSGGKRMYWPSSTEMFMCPWVKRWKDVQVDTYRRLVKAFAVRGVYIDQFGFADWGKTCWSKKHGHPVPARPLVAERELTRAVSEALRKIDPRIAVYTEETPCDVANGCQDGSFTYAMNEAQRTRTDVPLNISRFVFPHLKTFEILTCDRPTGSWATGVLWTFFNGEGIWLEGPAAQWFGPRTASAIRRTHAILRAHREAFTSPDVDPLVPTLVEEIHANRFAGSREVVYTLWNSLPVTFRGSVLVLPGSCSGKPVRDLWLARPVLPRPRTDGSLEIVLELGPWGVGCVCVEK